ncbi:unnamed protein product [Microthlaspi erraticum]|uniref:Uncharacterized protein n=1 Tax=Microthlaspi erraticum TaxID=1685480 RepID=A0A6D2KIE6_9BRAS|nr:unnamed protein product [Microthlaspi erraticum]
MTTKESYPRKGMIQDYLHLKNREGLELETVEWNLRLSQLLVAGGGMYVEVFNRGVIPLAYSRRKKNKAGETNTYLDEIYLLFTYFTNPESITPLETVLIADNDIIRSSSFKIKKRKYN